MSIIILLPCFLRRITLSITDVRWGKRYLVSRDLVGDGTFPKSVGVQFIIPKGYAGGSGLDIRSSK